MFSVNHNTYMGMLTISETIKRQAQTYQNWELLIQDDCSIDNTDKMVESYAANDLRIKYECNP